MAYNEAKKISNQKSDAKYSQILLKPYKEEAARIKKCAADEGMSTQGYILQAVRKQMDGEPIPGVVKNPESEPLTTEEPSCSVSPQLAEAIKKCAHDAIYNLSDEEIDKLRSNLEKLIFDSFTVERWRGIFQVPALNIKISLCLLNGQGLLLYLGKIKSQRG